MRALFVYSNKYERCNNIYYSMTQTAETWKKRYLPIFDELIVMGRLIDVDKVVGKMVSSTDNVTFKCTKYGLNSTDYFLKRKEIENEISDLVASVDFVIARQSFFGAIAAECAKKMNKPYIVEVVGSTWDSYWNYSIKGKIAAPYFEIQAKKMVKDASHVVYVTQEFLQKEYPTNGKTIGISNVEIDDPSEEVIKARLSKIKQNDDVLYICTAAAVDVKYKGQQYVIHAMARLRDQGYKFKYYIIGGGNQNRLKSLSNQLGIEDDIIFTGPITHDKVLEYMDKSDIYIQPSLQEGLPRAMIEAMSRGLPAIGFRTAGIPELLEKEYVCKRKSVSQLEQCLKKLMNNSERVQQATRNYNKSSEYSFSVLNKNRYNFFNQAIEDQKMMNK